MKKDINSALNEAVENLKEKSESIDSKDNILTAFVDGLGTLERININKSLDEIDAEVLEKDIVEIFLAIRNKASLNMLEAMGLDENSDDESEDIGVDIENVS